MKKNQILKIYGVSFRENTKKLLEKAGLAGIIGNTDRRILIKPNLVSPVPADFGATTHREIVAGIIEYLQEHGFGRLTVAEGSWVGDQTESALEICGYRKMLKEYSVPFIDTQKDAFFTRDCADMDLRVCSCVSDMDFLINVPVLKGHCQTKMTCALKNLKGLIPNVEKRRFHAMGLHAPIAHLNAGIHQDFIVVDHICGDLDSEDGGNPVVRNCIMAAMDPVLVDAYACYLMHYDVQDIPYITMAEDLKIGNAHIGEAEILELNHTDQKELPREHKLVELQDAVEEVESCSACYACLIPALEQLKEEGLLKFLDEKICIGQGYRGIKGNLGIGNCTGQFRYHVEGCPPDETHIYEGLRQYIRCRLMKKN